MNLEIQQLQEKILRRLSTVATAGKIHEVTRLSAMAAKTDELKTAADRIQSEIIEIQRSLDGPSQNEVAEELDAIVASLRSRSSNSTIEITIDWSKNGQPFGVEKISENLGSATMAKLIERLTKVLGQRVLDVASTMRVKRGPMISKDPQRDYWNSSARKPYGYRQINGTGFAVLTGTDSAQKVSDVTTLLRALGLVTGSYSVKKMTR
jgi:hypothetical protein